MSLGFILHVDHVDTSEITAYFLYINSTSSAYWRTKEHMGQGCQGIHPLVIFLR